MRDRSSGDPQLHRFSRLSPATSPLDSRIFIARVYQRVIAAGSPLLPAKNSPLFSQMYSIRADPRLSRRVPAKKRVGKKDEKKRAREREGSFVKRVCRYHESSSSSSLLRYGAAVLQKRCSPSLPLLTGTRKRYVPSARVARGFVFRAFRRVTGRGRASLRRAIRSDEKLADCAAPFAISITFFSRSGEKSASTARMRRALLFPLSFVVRATVRVRFDTLFRNPSARVRTKLRLTNTRS